MFSACMQLSADQETPHELRYSSIDLTWLYQHEFLARTTNPHHQILAQLRIKTVLENQNKSTVEWFSHIINIFQPLHPDGF